PAHQAGLGAVAGPAGLVEVDHAAGRVGGELPGLLAGGVAGGGHVVLVVEDEGAREVAGGGDGAVVAGHHAGADPAGAAHDVAPLGGTVLGDVAGDVAGH